MSRRGGFSTAIRVGSVTTVIGPNGAGKSTLLRAGYRADPALRRERALLRPGHRAPATRDA